MMLTGSTAYINALVFLIKYDRGFDPNEPRDEHGRWTEGGGGAQGELFPDLPPLPAAKGEHQLDDFVKDQVQVDAATRTDPDKQKKFLDRWNESVREAPAEFKQEFLGGLKATMAINYDDELDSLEITGHLLGDHDRQIGQYTRTINFSENKAVSDYFQLNGRSQQGKNVGKQMLAANVRMYQKLGLDQVEVHANIDVGGYAWAKYGYVPDEYSAGYLANDIRDKVGGGDSTPDEWAQLSDSQQDEVREAWKDAVRDEFYDSEISNWRDSGGDEAGRLMAESCRSTSPSACSPSGSAPTHGGRY